MVMQCNCLHPQIIVNPLVDELIALHGNYTIDGKKTTIKNKGRILYEGIKKRFSFLLEYVTLDNIDNYYISDNYSDTTYPIFLAVNCGHCEVCQQAKINAFVDRCRLETQLYNSQPIFLTLTYDEHHKPETGVSLRDCQLFFKRLRINLYRQGYREKIRYVLVSEYGKLGRPHYHAILWNLHQSDICSYWQIGEIIKKSWSNGFEMHRLVDPSDDKAFYYTSKYLFKSRNIPDGQNPTFMVCSNRGGAIGAAFIDRLARHAVKYLDTELKYVNRWNGKVMKVLVSKYMLNRICPSLSKSMCNSLKCRVRRFFYDYYILVKRCNVNVYMFDEKVRYFYEFFCKYFYIHQYEDGEHVREKDITRTDEQILKEMLQDEIYIADAMNKGEKYYEDAVYIAGRREKYLLKLFMHQTSQNLVMKAHNIRKIFAASLEREIL